MNAETFHRVRIDRELTLAQAAREIGIGNSTLSSLLKSDLSRGGKATRRVHEWIQERYNSGGDKIVLKRAPSGGTNIQRKPYLTILPTAEDGAVRIRRFVSLAEATKFCEEHFLATEAAKKIPAYRVLDTVTGNVLVGSKCTVYWHAPSAEDEKEFEIL